MRDKISLKCAMLLFLILLNIKCSEKTNPIRFEPPEPPKLAIRTIPVPEKMVQSPDSMVQRAVEYMNLVNSIGNYEIYIIPTDTSKLQFQGDDLDNPKWTSTWINDSLAIGLTISEMPNVYNWDVRFTGTKNSKSYRNTNVFKVRQVIERGYVSIFLFDIEPLNFASWSCVTDNDGTYTMSMSASEEVIEGEEIVISEKPDGSGELILWKDEWKWVQKFKAKWEPDGAGQWWTYDMNGHTLDTGFWI